MNRASTTLIIATLLLVTIGIIMVYSSSSIQASIKHGDGAYYLKKQIFFVIIGLSAMVFIARTRYRSLQTLSWPLLAISAALLALVLIPDIGVKINAARRWLPLGFVNLQASEVAKLSLVLFLADSLTRKEGRIRDFGSGLLPHLIIAGVLALLILFEPDYGTATIIMLLTLTMLFIAGARVTHLAGIFALIAPVGLALLFTAPYRLKRLIGFLYPWDDPLDSGYQLIQSHIAIGSGGLLGLGLGDGRQKLFYLPEAHTDYVLSIIGEELGFAGIVLVIALYGVLIAAGMWIARHAYERFGSLLASGITVLIGFECIINIGTAFGLLPPKGLTLPFISYGGSSLIMKLAMIGILISIGSYEREKRRRPS